MTATTDTIKVFNQTTGKTREIKRKVSKKVQTAIGKVVNEANAAADKLEEQGVPEEVTRLIRPAITKEKERGAKILRAKALWNNGYSYQEIAETLGVAESTARSYVGSGDEVITLEGLSTLTLRIREYKREGLSNVAIGQRVGVSESTVRRRLKMPLTEEETLLEAMYDELANVREEIVQNISEHPMFERLFNVREMGDGWFLRVNTIKRRASFARRDGVGQRMSFTLEFAAYRQPLKQENNED